MAFTPDEMENHWRVWGREMTSSDPRKKSEAMIAHSFIYSSLLGTRHSADDKPDTPRVNHRALEGVFCTDWRVQTKEKGGLAMAFPDHLPSLSALQARAKGPR